MKAFPAISWLRSWDVLFLILLLPVVWRTGQTRLDNWHGPAGSLTNDLFIPAITLNAGYGFKNIDAAQIPEMRAFLDFQRQSFDVGLIPAEAPFLPLHPYQEFHRYLIYSVALCWRIFGVTWDAVKILILIYFCLAGIAVYGISRLGMNPVFSFLVAAVFAHAPAVLWTLPVLRDFAKAPFILAVALLLGIVISKALSPRKFFVTALLLGALLGAGMGIRRDMMVFLPISVCFLCVSAVKSQGERCLSYGRGWVAEYAVLTRLYAIALFLIAFILVGWPVHRSLAREGYLAAHDTIMGFSSFSDHELGVLQPASYEKHYLLNDMYSTIKAHYAAGLGVTFSEQTYLARVNEPKYDFEMKRAYVQAIAKTFPADMLTRAYAAVLRSGTGIVATPIGVEKYGLWFIAAGLLFIALRHPFRAWLALAMLCYFCGYTSIQFAIRHAFHTSFVPFFFMGFVAHHLTVSITKRNEEPPRSESRRRLCVRIATWALLTVAMFWLPLQVARYVQTGNVRALRDAYAAAALAPVAHKTLVWDGRVLFAPLAPIHAEDFQGQGLLADFETGVLVAAFDDVDTAMALHAVFEWEGGISDFGGPLNTVIHEDKVPVAAKLYFPVHEKTTYAADWSRFVGLSMSNEAALHFQGFYKVLNLKDLGLLVNMLLPEAENRFLYNQRLSIPWKGASWTPYPASMEFDPLTHINEISGLIVTGDYDQAIASASQALQQRPGSIVFTLALAEALERTGNVQKADEAYIALLETFPNLPAVYARLYRHFGEHGGIQRRIQAWTAILEHDPAFAAAEEYRERAVLDLATAGKTR